MTSSPGLTPACPQGDFQCHSPIGGTNAIPAIMNLSECLLKTGHGALRICIILGQFYPLPIGMTPPVPRAQNVKNRLLLPCIKYRPAGPSCCPNRLPTRYCQFPHGSFSPLHQRMKQKTNIALVSCGRELMVPPRPPAPGPANQTLQPPSTFRAVYHTLIPWRNPESKVLNSQYVMSTCMKDQISDRPKQIWRLRSSIRSPVTLMA